MASEITQVLGQLTKVEQALNALHRQRQIPLYQAAELVSVAQARKEMVQAVRHYHSEAVDDEMPPLVRRAIDEARSFITFAREKSIIDSEEGAA